MKYPLDAGNYTLILIGLGLIVSGPYIFFTTFTSIFKSILNKKKPAEKLPSFWDYVNYLFNFLISIIFLGGGALCVFNNLKGNPFM